VKTTHGFARDAVWTYDPSSTSGGGSDSVSAVFSLSGTAIPEPFPRTLSLQYRVNLTADSLTTSLTIVNAGAEEFKFKALYHNYFAVEDSQKVAVSGFAAGQGYVDNMKGGSKEVWEGGYVPMKVETGK
jgi:glucose-6-phosphate 1-epimerase